MWWWLAGPGFKITASVKQKRSRYFLPKLRTNLVKHPLWLHSGKTRPFQLPRFAEAASPCSKKWWVVTVLKPAVFHSAAVEFRREEWFALSGTAIHTQSSSNTFSVQFQSQNENCLENHRFFFLLQKKKNPLFPFLLGNQTLKSHANFHSSLPRKANKVIFKIYNLTVKWKWFRNQSFGNRKNHSVPFQKHCQ